MAGLEQPNGDLGHLKVYLAILKDVWNTFGLPTIMLVVILLLWIGVIPSPMGEARMVLDTIKVSLDKHLERDREMIFYMKGLCLSNAEIAKTAREDCLWKPE